MTLRAFAVYLPVTAALLLFVHLTGGWFALLVAAGAAVLNNPRASPSQHKTPRG